MWCYAVLRPFLQESHGVNIEEDAVLHSKNVKIRTNILVQFKDDHDYMQLSG
jgi:hypothetical protein